MAICVYRTLNLDAGGDSDMVTRLAALLSATLILTGCAPVDLHQMMGRTEGTATTAPKLLDCDLIFPAPSPDTLKP